MRRASLQATRAISVAGVLLNLGCLRSLPEIPEGAPTGTVSGQVLADGQPQSGIQVGARQFSGVTHTDDAGNFELRGLPLGPLALRLLGPDGIERWVSAESFQTLGDAQALRIEWNRLGRIEGTLDVPDPTRWAGAWVVLDGTERRTLVDHTGAFQLNRIAPGSYAVTVLPPPDAQTTDILATAQVQVQSDAITTVTPRAVVPGPVTVRGSVRLGFARAQGTSVEFLRLNRRPAEPTPSAVPDDEGQFELSLAAGVYRVRFSSSEAVPMVSPPQSFLTPTELDPVQLRPAAIDDQDADGIPDAQDDDRDNDGCVNLLDRFPDDPGACGDADGDGDPDVWDADDDNDSVSDLEETFFGGDGLVSDPHRLDTDQDGIADLDDLCPTVPGTVGADCRFLEVRPAPRIANIEPARAAPGQILTISGEMLLGQNAHLIRVQFGDDPNFIAIDGFASTERELRVVVPASAKPGPVRLLHPAGVTQSTTAFELGTSTVELLFAGPQDRVGQPVQLSPGQRLSLWGEGLSRFEKRTAYLRSVSATGDRYIRLQAPLLQRGATATIDEFPNRALEHYFFPLPKGAVSGPIHLRLENDREVIELVSPNTVGIFSGVHAGALIDAAAPGPAGDGDTHTYEVFGLGFARSNASKEDLQVWTADNRPAEILSLSDDRLVVELRKPLRMLEQLRVVHPASEDLFTAPYTFQGYRISLDDQIRPSSPAPGAPTPSPLAPVPMQPDGDVQALAPITVVSGNANLIGADGTVRSFDPVYGYTDEGVSPEAQAQLDSLVTWPLAVFINEGELRFVNGNVPAEIGLPGGVRLRANTGFNYEGRLIRIPLNELDTPLRPGHIELFYSANDQVESPWPFAVIEETALPSVRVRPQAVIAAHIDAHTEPPELYLARLPEPNRIEIDRIRLDGSNPTPHTEVWNTPCFRMRGFALTPTEGHMVALCQEPSGASHVQVWRRADRSLLGVCPVSNQLLSPPELTMAPGGRFALARAGEGSVEIQMAPFGCRKLGQPYVGAFLGPDLFWGTQGDSSELSELYFPSDGAVEETQRQARASDEPSSVAAVFFGRGQILSRSSAGFDQIRPAFGTGSVNDPRPAFHEFSGNVALSADRTWGLSARGLINFRVGAQHALREDQRGFEMASSAQAENGEVYWAGWDREDVLQFWRIQTLQP